MLVFWSEYTKWSHMSEINVTIFVAIQFKLFFSLLLARNELIVTYEVIWQESDYHSGKHHKIHMSHLLHPLTCLSQMVNDRTSSKKKNNIEVWKSCGLKYMWKIDFMYDAISDLKKLT